MQYTVISKNTYCRYTEKVPSDVTSCHVEDDTKKTEGPASSPLQKIEADTSKKSDGDCTLSKASDTTSDSEATLEGGENDGNDSEAIDDNHFLSHLMKVFWSLHNAKPTSLFLTPMCQPGEDIIF